MEKSTTKRTQACSDASQGEESKKAAISLWSFCLHLYGGLQISSVLFKQQKRYTPTFDYQPCSLSIYHRYFNSLLHFISRKEMWQ